MAPRVPLKNPIFAQLIKMYESEADKVKRTHQNIFVQLFSAKLS